VTQLLASVGGTTASRVRNHDLWSAAAPFAQVVVVAAFATLGIRPLGDPDLGWHLRTGQMIVHHGFTTVDPWSFASTRPWVLHEWGGEVIMYAAYAADGYTGVMALRVLLMALLGYLVMRACRREAGPWAALAAASLALLSISTRATERPQLISFCLLAAVLPALRHQVKTGRDPWWFPAVVLVWVNVHAMWSVALIFYAALVVGRLIDLGWGEWRQIRKLVLIGALSGLAVLVNPSGFRLIGVFRVGGENFIREFAPPALFSVTNLPTMLLVLVILIQWARSSEVVPVIDVVFVVVAVAVGLTYNRSIPIAAIALAPIAAHAIGTFRQPRDTPVDSVVPRSPRDRYAVALLTAVFVIAVAIRIPQVPDLVAGTPDTAMQSLDNLPGRAKVLNEYGLGGWIIWTARDTSPGIDGRSEIYDPAYVSSYFAALRMSPGWKEWVEHQPFDAAWLYSTTPLIDGLKELGWHVLRKDGVMILLVPPQA
jgi:hypothetical protein